VTGMIRRGLRLEFVAALGLALAAPTLPLEAASSTGVAAQTTLTVETHDHAGRTQADFSVAIAAADGLPATGAVTLMDNGRSLAGAALDKQGNATLHLNLPAGEHDFTATYAGDAAHGSSISQTVHARAQAVTTPDFQISIAPGALSLAVGKSGTITATVTPENAAALTTPLFVTLSCSGLPDESQCTFTPENIEILPTSTAPIISSMVLVTQLGEGSIARPGDNRLVLAVLFPGAFALGGLACAFRRRPRLQRLSLLALLALVTSLGTTACNPQYNFLNHGPPPNQATPAGTYNVAVTAQSSNGVTAISNSTSLALTVQ
jgi:hypothetical protein